MILIRIALLFLLVLPAGAKSIMPERKIKVGDAFLVVEVAENNENRAQGLMNRDKLADGRGMLFIFEDEQVLSFWMKNTFIPLTIGFFDRNRRLIDIQDMDPVKTVLQSDIPTYKSKKPALYALEVPRGWFKKNKIKLNQRMELLGQP